MELIRKAIGAYITFALVFIILGICFLAWPHTSLVTICYAIGGVILAWGVVKILNFVKNKELNHSFVYQLNLIIGIFLAVIGLILIVMPNLILPIFPIIIGIVITADGFQKIKAGLDAKKMNHEKWWIIVFAALVTITFGMCLIFDPFTATDAMIRLIGITLIIDGIQNLVVILSTFKLMSSMVSEEEIKNAEFVDADIPNAPNDDVVTEKISPEDIIIEDNNK